MERDGIWKELKDSVCTGTLELWYVLRQPLHFHRKCQSYSTVVCHMSMPFDIAHRMSCWRMLSLGADAEAWKFPLRKPRGWKSWTWTPGGTTSDDNPGRSTRKNGAVRRVMKRSHICHVHCAVWWCIAPAARKMMRNGLHQVINPKNDHVTCQWINVAGRS